MYPGSLFGTHLHDYNGAMIEKRPNKSLVPGDCFGYYGARGWWYMYDAKTNIITMYNLREDKILLDNFRITNVPYEKVKEMFDDDKKYQELIASVKPLGPGDYRIFGSRGWYLYDVPDKYISITKSQKELMDQLLKDNVPFEKVQEIISNQ
jgi:hypothetical protein